jgi:hypothetical protein
MNTNTLSELRSMAAATVDAAGEPLPHGETSYFMRMLDRITESDTGCWVWTGSVRSGSPEIKWPGFAWGAMVRRKTWRLATGTEPGDGERSLSRTCREPRCVRPHPDHVIESPYRKGGGSPLTSPKLHRFSSRSGDASRAARAVCALLRASAELRSLNLDPHEFTCSTQGTDDPTSVTSPQLVPAGGF